MRQCVRCIEIGSLRKPAFKVFNHPFCHRRSFIVIIFCNKLKIVQINNAHILTDCHSKCFDLSEGFRKVQSIDVAFLLNIHRVHPTGISINPKICWLQLDRICCVLHKDKANLVYALPQIIAGILNAKPTNSINTILPRQHMIAVIQLFNTGQRVQRIEARSIRQLILKVLKHIFSSGRTSWFGDGCHTRPDVVNINCFPSCRHENTKGM